MRPQFDLPTAMSTIIILLHSMVLRTRSEFGHLNVNLDNCKKIFYNCKNKLSLFLFPRF